MSKNTGLTLIEILMAISIIIVISSLALMSLSSFRSQQVLKSTTVDIMSILNKAKQNTLSSLNSTNYGVHFESGRVTLFVGPTYSQGIGTNEVTVFDQAVEIPTVGGINVGGGSDVVFERLTGETLGGTIVVQLKSNTSKQKTITINKTGIISSN